MSDKKTNFRALRIGKSGRVVTMSGIGGMSSVVCAEKIVDSENPGCHRCP